MLRKHTLVTVPALVASVFLLTGCPPPSDFEQWKRPNTTKDQLRAAMGSCGVQIPGPVTRMTDNETVLYFQCMENKGFVYNEEFHICDYLKNTPACTEKSQGHPLSQRQLDALPFVADTGFNPVDPKFGIYESQLITWRKVGASRSLGLSDEVKNDREALPVMYQCGYPQPLGSRPYLPTLRQAQQVQQCMLDKGFEPIGKLNLVCRNYPQVTGCKPSS